MDHLSLHLHATDKQTKPETLKNESPGMTLHTLLKKPHAQQQETQT